MEMHRDAVEAIDAAGPRRAARPRPAPSGTTASSSGRRHGYRNSQVTVLAPTGTIAFMMDCDTTGRRARHRAGEVQAAGRRRDAQDRQPDRADGPAEARLRRAGDPRDPRLHRRPRHDRGAPRTCRTSTCRSSTARSPRRRGAGASTSAGHLRMMAAVQPFLWGRSPRRATCRTTRPSTTSATPTSKAGSSA